MCEKASESCLDGNSADGPKCVGDCVREIACCAKSTDMFVKKLVDRSLESEKTSFETSDASGFDESEKACCNSAVAVDKAEESTGETDECVQGCCSS